MNTPVSAIAKSLSKTDGLPLKQGQKAPGQKLPRSAHHGLPEANEQSSANSDGLTQVNPSRSQQDEGKIQRGREAFQRQQRGWEDWMAVAEVLIIGRAEVMLTANTSDPRGKRYQKDMGVWLIENGFKGLDKSIRSRLLKCLEDRGEIEKWRATLTEPERLRYNHPNTVLRKWKSRTILATTKRKSRTAEFNETVQRLEDENFALRRRKEVGQTDEPQLPEFPSQTPDIALFLPPDMPSNALRRLNADVRRIQEKYQVRCVWNTRSSANDGGGDV